MKQEALLATVYVDLRDTSEEYGCYPKIFSLPAALEYYFFNHDFSGWVFINPR